MNQFSAIPRGQLNWIGPIANSSKICAPCFRICSDLFRFECFQNKSGKPLSADPCCKSPKTVVPHKNAVRKKGPLGKEGLFERAHRMIRGFWRFQSTGRGRVQRKWVQPEHVMFAQSLARSRPSGKIRQNPAKSGCTHLGCTLPRPTDSEILEPGERCCLLNWGGDWVLFCPTFLSVRNLCVFVLHVLLGAD